MLRSLELCPDTGTFWILTQIYIETVEIVPRNHGRILGNSVMFWSIGYRCMTVNENRVPIQSGKSEKMRLPFSSRGKVREFDKNDKNQGKIREFDKPLIYLVHSIPLGD